MPDHLKNFKLCNHDPRLPLTEKFKIENGIDFRSSVLVIKLFGAKNLRAADLNGFSDPYAMFDFVGYRLRSSIKSKTLQPDWNEILLFRESSKHLFLPGDRLFIKVKDHDIVGYDDFLGNCVVSLSHIIEKSTQVRLHSSKNMNYIQKNNDSVTSMSSALDFPELEALHANEISDPLSESLYYKFAPEWFSLFSSKTKKKLPGSIKLGFEFYPRLYSCTTAFSHIEFGKLDVPLKLKIPKADEIIDSNRKKMYQSLVLKKRPILEICILKGSLGFKGKLDSKCYIKVSYHKKVIQTTTITYKHLFWNEKLILGTGIDFLMPGDIISIEMFSKTSFGRSSSLGKTSFPLWRYLVTSENNMIWSWLNLSLSAEANNDPFSEVHLLLGVKYTNPFLATEVENKKDLHKKTALAQPQGRYNLYQVSFRPVSISNIAVVADKGKNSLYGISACGNQKQSTNVITEGIPVFLNTMEFTSSHRFSKGVSQTDSLVFEIRQLSRTKESFDIFSDLESVGTFPAKSTFAPIGIIVIDLAAIIQNHFGTLDGEGMTLVRNISLGGNVTIKISLFILLRNEVYFSLKRAYCLEINKDIFSQQSQLLADGVNLKVEVNNKVLLEQHIQPVFIQTNLYMQYFFEVDQSRVKDNVIANLVHKSGDTVLFNECFTKSCLSSPQKNTCRVNDISLGYTEFCSYHQFLLATPLKPIIGAISIQILWHNFDFKDSIFLSFALETQEVILGVSSYANKVVSLDVLSFSSLLRITPLDYKKKTTISGHWEGFIYELYEASISRNGVITLEIGKYILRFTLNFKEYISGTLATASPEESYSEVHANAIKGIIHEIGRLIHNVNALTRVLRKFSSYVYHWRSACLSLGIICALVVYFTSDFACDRFLALFPLCTLIYIGNSHKSRVNLKDNLRKSKLLKEDTEVKLSFSFLDVQTPFLNQNISVDIFYLNPETANFSYVKSRIVNKQARSTCTTTAYDLSLPLQNSPKFCYTITAKVIQFVDGFQIPYLLSTQFELLQEEYELGRLKLLHKENRSSSARSIFMEEFLINNISFNSKQRIRISFISTTSDTTMYEAILPISNFSTDIYHHRVPLTTTTEEAQVCGTLLISITYNAWSLRSIREMKKCSNTDLCTDFFGSTVDEFNNVTFFEDWWTCHSGVVKLNFHSVNEYLGFCLMNISDICDRAHQHKRSISLSTHHLTNGLLTAKDVKNWRRLLAKINSSSVPSDSSENLSLNDYVLRDNTGIIKESMFGKALIKVKVIFPDKHILHQFRRQEELIRTENLSVFEPTKAILNIHKKLKIGVDALATGNDYFEKTKNLFSWVHPETTAFLAKLMIFLFIISIVIPSRILILLGILFLLTEHFRKKGVIKTKIIRLYSMIPSDDDLRLFYNKEAKFFKEVKEKLISSKPDSSKSPKKQTKRSSLRKLIMKYTKQKKFNSGNTST